MAASPLNQGMDISTLADSLLGDAGGTALNAAGPASSHVYDLVKSEVHTTPLLATSFWQAFISSSQFSEVLHSLGASPVAASQGESYVVCHGKGWPRFDLIVFDPDFRSDEPQARNIEARDQTLTVGWEKFRDRLNLREPRFKAFEAALIEANKIQPFGIIVARRPATEYTCIPNPAWRISCTSVSGKSMTSTAGIIAKNATGKIGVTAALHGLGSARQVTVGSMAGTVITEDVISDSAFIELDNPSIPTLGGRNGPLQGVTPRVFEQVTFNGAVSNLMGTIVTGWSPDLPYALPYSQLKVLTKADTNPGDSGAALVDSNDHLLGFSFYRTGFGAPIEYSTWIWAESVFKAHGLSII